MNERSPQIAAMKQAVDKKKETELQSGIRTAKEKRGT
jgi:hypothetical protein